MTPPQENTNVAPQQDMAVLDQVKKERGAPQRLTTEEILAKSLEGSGQDPLKFQAALSNLIETDNKFRVSRSGNTLFIFYRVSPDTVEIQMETADNARGLVNAMKDAAAAAKAAGFKHGIAEVTNPDMVKAYRAAGLNFQLRSTGGVMEDGQTPEQYVTLEF